MATRELQEVPKNMRKTSLIKSRITVRTKSIPLFLSIRLQPVYSFLSRLEEMFCQFSFGDVGHQLYSRTGCAMQYVEITGFPRGRISRKLCSKIVVDVSFSFKNNTVPSVNGFH